MQIDAQKDPKLEPNALHARLLINQVCCSLFDFIPLTGYIHIPSSYHSCYPLIDADSYFFMGMKGGQKIGEANSDDISLWCNIYRRP